MKKLGLTLLALATVGIAAISFNMKQAMKSMKSNYKCLSSGGLTCKSDAVELAQFQQTLQACDQNIEAYYVDLVSQKMIPSLPVMDQVHAAFGAILKETQNLSLAIQKGDAAGKSLSIRNIKIIMDKAHDDFRPEL